MTFGAFQYNGPKVRDGMERLFALYQLRMFNLNRIGETANTVMKKMTTGVFPVIFLSVVNSSNKTSSAPVLLLSTADDDEGDDKRHSKY